MSLRLVLSLSLLSLAGHGMAATVRTSASVRVFGDTNLYLQNPSELAAGQGKPGVSPEEHAAGLDACVSMTATWKQAGGNVLELGYTPQVIRYIGHASENHVDHALNGTATGQLGGWTGEVKARYLLVNGSELAPIYNAVGGSPALGGEPVRARRSQAIARASGKAAHALPHGFVRGVFSMFDQRFHTREQTVPYYCNYADRNETMFGAETGWRVKDQIAAVLAVRSGVQRQANVLGTPYNFSNTFTRYLVGFEGQVAKSLKLALLAGPEVHHFGDSVRPGYPHEQRTGYGELSATYTPGARDVVALSAKRFLWFPGAGRGVYVDGIVDVTWKRKLNESWSTAAGANYHWGDTSHFNAWAPRNDRVYTVTAGVSRQLGNKVKLDLDLMRDWGVSLLPNTPGREYQRWIISSAVSRGW